MADDKNIGPCRICQAPSSLKCTGCLNVYYCSSGHQKQDWKEHKRNCSLLIHTQDDKYGRYWVAARNIKAGELILKELPVVSAPFTKSDQLDVCVSCCTLLFPPGTPAPSEIRKSCSKCGWPVCGVQCEKAAVHAKNECPLLVSRSTKFPPPGLNLRETYDGLTFLRAILLKSKRPKVWEKLLDLQYESKRAEFYTNPEEKVRVLEEPMYTTAAIYVAFDLHDLAGESIWLRVRGLQTVNQFALNRQEVGKLLPSQITGIYLKASLFTHSCVPNASRTMSYFPEFELHIRAATDIKKGEMITINYYAEAIFYGTDKRLEETTQRSGFMCHCPRCTDPTELGTYSSAIICDKCPAKGTAQGIMLPKTFHDLNEPYRCQTPGCDNTKGRAQVAALVSKHHREISETESLDLTTDATKLEDFIRRVGGKVFHQNHWLLQEAARGCLIAYEDEWSTNNESLARFLIHGRRAEEYTNIIAPGISFEHSALLLKVVQALLHDVEQQQSSLEPNEARDRWKEVHDWATGSLKYWVNDVQNKPKGKEMSQEAEVAASITMQALHYLKSVQ